jgi:preprotein translocase subunit SecD
VISAPVINEPLPGGSGIITGNFTVESAGAGAAAALGRSARPLNVEDQRTVTAELGADAVKAGSISLAIGAAAMFVFIILAYGLFGVFAAIALVVNVLMIIGIMSMTQATLTFPGIAGLILTLAVAVDANVLIYERMRDEANAGRTPMSAADTGFRLALVSILDANITSLISALIMFGFGSGPVKGFAWTLSIGVFTSVFTAIIITQVLIGWWFKSRQAEEAADRIGDHPCAWPLIRYIPRATHFRFVKWAPVAAVFSAILIAGSGVSLFTQGLNLGIDFKGGVAWKRDAPAGPAGRDAHRAGPHRRP